MAAVPTSVLTTAWVVLVGRRLLRLRRSATMGSARGQPRERSMVGSILAPTTTGRSSTRQAWLGIKGLLALAAGGLVGRILIQFGRPRCAVAGRRRTRWPTWPARASG